MEAAARNCIIVHGCPHYSPAETDPETRTYDKNWIPRTKAQLEARGIRTETPLMPTPWKPDYAEYKKVFERYVIDESSILVGHSCGCAFLARWLGDTKRHVFRLVFVAPWKIPDKGDEIRKTFYDFPIDETIRARIGDVVMFTADNEADDGKRSLEIYHKALGGKILELKGRGHYISEHMKTDEFPELIDAIMG